MTINSLYITVDVDTHGALESGHLAAWRRTLGLWCIAIAQQLLGTRIDVTFCQKR
jgi:hypothetical protein